MSSICSVQPWQCGYQPKSYYICSNSWQKGNLESDQYFSLSQPPVRGQQIIMRQGMAGSHPQHLQWQREIYLEINNFINLKSGNKLCGPKGWLCLLRMHRTGREWQDYIHHSHHCYYYCTIPPIIQSESVLVKAAVAWRINNSTSSHH